MAASHGRGHRPHENERRDFSVAYNRHATDVYRFCLRQVKDPGLAEEVMSTVFLEAWRRRSEVDFTSRPIRPWLFGAARNVLRNQRRAQLRQEAAVRSLEHTHRHDAADPSEELARQQEVGALLSSLRALPAGQRQVVALCLLRERSYEAAADDLEVPVGTVRSRLNRARLNLALAIRKTAGT